jgi:8-oxo-dGTP diphosphatase
MAQVSTDVVIFTIRNDNLCVLLIKRARGPFADHWALPGGRVGEREALEQAADRMLAEKTGVTGVYLEQLYTFGGLQRDPRGRVVSVAHYALVPGDRVQLSLAAEGVAWHEVERLPALAFDHQEIVAMAKRRLAAKLEYSTIALQLMPEKFTLGELQTVYESILGTVLDKRNFRKRLQGLGCLEETGEEYRGGNHRPAKLFRVKRPGRVEIIK